MMYPSQSTSPAGAHFVKQPGFLLFVRIAQVVLSLIVLALSAFAISVFSGWSGTFGFNIFCCIVTWISAAYFIAVPKFNINLWNMWAALALHILNVIFWLSAWSSMASFAALKNGVWGGYSYSSLLTRDAMPKKGGKSSSTSTSFDDYDFDDLVNSTNDITTRTKDYYAKWEAAWKCSAAAAGLGALIWVLAIVALVFYSIALHRHRTAPENAHLPKDGRPAGEKGQQHEMYPPPQ